VRLALVGRGVIDFTSGGFGDKMLSSYDKALRLAQRRRAKDLPQTRKVYELLLDADGHGDARATYALATWYLHGSEFTKVDVRRATALLRKAAAADIADANYDLAVSYEKGVGLPKSLSKAFECYTKAALLGDAPSHYEVGRMLYFGIGTPRNRRLADAWLKKAETLGVEISRDS
jgi:uncharacterized protein